MAAKKIDPEAAVPPFTAVVFNPAGSGNGVSVLDGKYHFNLATLEAARNAPGADTCAKLEIFDGFGREVRQPAR